MQPAPTPRAPAPSAAGDPPLRFGAADGPGLDAPAPPHPVVLGSRAVAVLSLVALVALGLAWELWLAPTGSGLLALKVLPLLVPLPGLLRMRLYTYRWVSLVVWLYFTEGVVRATGLPPGAALGTTEWLAWGEVALCLVLFTACTLHVRWRLAHRSLPPATVG